MRNKPNIWIGTSWKMNKTLDESKLFANSLLKSPSDNKVQRFVIPPFTSVREVKNILSKSDVMVGAQNMHWEDEGAWTGEISPKMLVDCNLDIVEIGHSERRKTFAETDETVSLKVAAAIKNNLIPLICIGENEEDKQTNNADSVLSKQVDLALSKVKEFNKSTTILFAYEPVWAIGVNGIPATPEYTNSRHENIIETTRKITGIKLPCLYGGSVSAENCIDLIKCSNVNGLFIGRSAWSVDGYIDILSRCNNVI